MRDQNRLKEKFHLSLDGRQVTSVVVGSLVILGAVFVLGLNVGKQLGERERAARQPADPLAALDAPPPSADAGESPKLSYHEALTKDEAGSARRRAAAKPEHEKERPAEPPRAQEPKPAAAPPKPSASASAEAKGDSAEPSAPPAAGAARGPALVLNTPPLAPPSAPEPSRAPAPSGAAPGSSPGDSASKGPKAASFAIQVGATQDIGEAQRIADRFKGHRPRIVSAEIPGKGRWYRVKVGAFETRPEAERYLKDLSRETSARGFVTTFN